jgi:arylsulfatase A-like enzyme
MVRWPGVAGRVERNLISSVDLSATVCAIGGTTPPGSDGRNLTPLITTGAAVRDAAYIEPPGGGAGWSALRTTRYKFVEYGNGGRELYDLANDPWELTNVYFSPAYQSTVASLHSRLQSLKP